MKRILILTIGLLMLLSLNSSASETRTMVMGDNDMILVDDYNIFRFPGRVNNYPNLAGAEFNTTDDFHNFGVNWQFGDDESPWVLGTYFSTAPPTEPTDYLLGATLVDLDMYVMAALLGDLEPTNRRIDLLYGRELFGHNFGFRFDYTRGSYENEGVEKEAFGYYQFGVGLTEAATGQWDFALNVGFGSWTDQDGDGKKLTEPNGYYDLVLEGRHFRMRNPKITLVEHGSLGIGKRGVTDFGADLDDAADDVSWSQSLFAINVGVGMNYTPGPDMLAAFDFGIEYNKLREEQTGVDDETISDLILPYFKIGLEAEVFHWMDIRLGATSIWQTVDAEMFDVKVNAAENDTYLGFGFHWGRLYIDTYTDPEIVLDGFNFISGTNDAEDLNVQVSATYEMF